MDQHVLVPVDGSSAAEEAFEHALERVPMSSLTLLHVIDPAHMLGFGSTSYFDMESYKQEAERRRNQAEDLLERYRQRAEIEGFEVETLIKSGRPEDRILETIEEEDIDKVVIGSTGKSGIGRVILGSVTEAVAQRSSVPVTIVR